MSTHKYFDRICAAALAVCLLVTLLLYNGEALGLRAAAAEIGYESRLFATDRVHTIDIVIDDWERFLSTAQSEEYSLCDVVIDGEAVQNVGIRGKGNTSLSTVSSMDSDRYSFKIEFDQYDSTKTYHGLDKLCLNNLIQDNTMMKDFLVYQLMGQFGAAAPLCSFAYLTVNGEDWGLYLAVEAVEDSFLRRNYGSDYGELYKPDSMSMGGGRGNGRDFDMNGFLQQENGAEDTGSGAQQPSRQQAMPGGMGGFGGMSNFDPSQMDSDASQLPEGFDPSSLFGGEGSSEMPALPEDFAFSEMFGGGMGGFGGMGSSDVKLQYIDDDPGSYSNIFDSAKTDVTDADKARLVAALKALGQGDTTAVDMEAQLRYLVVHNFVVNGDSYTGSMVHNYYLYEEDGALSMIPWDYNLAFGTFQGGSTSGAVNDDIDAPLSCTGSGDRPMMDWVLNDEEALALYHWYFAEFLDGLELDALIDGTATLIAPYVEKDPTRFCTYEAFQTGVAALKTFCQLRTESVQRQLRGDDTPVETGDLNLSELGTMNMGGGFGGGRGQLGQFGQTDQTSESMEEGAEGQTPQLPSIPAMPDSESAAPGSDGTQSSEVPDSTENTGSTGRDFGNRGGMTGQMPGGLQDTASSNRSLLMLAVSGAVLGLGLLIAFKYKR